MTEYREHGLPELPGGKTSSLGVVHLDSKTMDAERNHARAYDYLCRIGEAKDWLEACIKQKDLCPIEKLEEHLRDGITLAHLAKCFAPGSVKKIFEDKTKLQFRHSDNINYFFNATRSVGLPDIFLFELTDLYDKKNMPKVIYCIHVLSHLLAKKGLAPHIKDLQGRLQFTDEVLGNAAKDLDDSGVAMPEFGNIKKELDKELKIEETDEERKAREERERLESLSKQFEMNPDGLIKIQAMCRGRIQRQAYLDQLRKYKDHEHAFTKLQAAFKGKKAREEYLKLKKFYQSKVKQIVKIQSWWRGVQCRNNYRALKLSKFVNVAVIQEYLTLFESSDEELDEDRIVEELRAKVIQKIRDNLSLEANLNILDEKVALLIKNRISLEEVAKFKSKDMRAALAKSAAQSQAEQAVLTFRGRDKATNDKRKKYEALFYLLQTQPVYLAGLMFTLTRTSGGAATKFLEQVILTLYGYAQNTREEYLFLRLIENSISMEVTVTKQSDEVVKENPVFVKLVLQYIRGAKERDYLRGLFRPLLDLVLKNSELELELDPIAIYKGIIRQEEISTGKSSLPHDITAEAAAKNPQVKEIQLKNFALITNITDTFLSSIIKSADKMPFGIRFIAMRMRQIMQEKYPGPEHEKNINLWVGNMLYYRYLNPVIVAPEAFDVIETSISPIQRKNLAEIARLLQQVSVYDPKKAETAMNEKGSYADQAAQYFKSASVKFAQFLKEASNTVTCEEYFDMTEFVDSGRVEKHTVYITPDEIVQLHNCLHENLIQLPVIPNDPLGTIMRELGEPPKNGTAAKGPGSEIVLHLSDRFAGAVDNAEVELRKLQKETKRIILTILRFATGKTLLDILETPCTNAQEKAFAAYVAQQETNRKLVSESQTLGKKASLEMLKASSMEMLHEESRQSKGTLEDLNVASAPLATPAYKTPDGKNMNFAQLKVKALENMAKLEKHDKVSKADNYQSMLDAIVQDMLNKQRRRQQRRTEIQRFRTTMANLTEKSVFLKESLQSYNNYIDGCMAQLNKKGGKQKKPMLFSKQYFHMQEVKKSGKEAKFGSFKYTASALHEKGVLVSIDDCSVKQYPLINITISSNEQGVFLMEASLFGTKASEKETLRLEDLLQDQYNKVDIITVFDIAKINLNLLIFLINKK